MAGATKNDEVPPGRKLSRAERRHGMKRKPAEEPTLQIPKGPLIAAIAVLVVAAILGIRTSLLAASNSKPFSMEGFDKKKGADEPAAEPLEPDPRDTTEGDYPNGDWLEDPILAKSMGIDRCDFDRVPHANMTTKRFAREYEGVKPVIIEGLVAEKWPALTAGRWARPSLKDSFGLSPIHVSSGSGIVHSGGESLHTVALGSFLEGLRENDGDGVSATAFTFDLEFVESNKEVKKDYKVPTIFRRFNSHESMRRGQSWSILSLGASGAGLPFHSHGETWLGLVYGAKRWALYPPSASRPYKAEQMAEWHPLMGSFEWFEDVEPLIKKTGESPPLECVQNAGDIMYLPANWAHMTLNIGESIAVGGQAVYHSEIRLQDGLDLLIKMPDDPVVLHSVGVGLAHRGIEALKNEDDPMAAKDGDLDFESRLNLLRARMPMTAMQTLETAADSLKKAMVKRPGYPETHVILAETLSKAGKLEEAEEVIEKAWKQFSRDELPESIPDSTLIVIQLNLARFFLQIENGAKAETFLRAGPLALQPNHGDAMADLAVALVMQGQDRLQDAVDLLEEAESLGAAGESFTRRSNFVMRMVMQTAQQMGSDQAETEEGEGGTEGAKAEETS